MEMQVSEVQGLAEGSGSRTHQARLTPLNGFEARAHHRNAIPFRRRV